MFTYSSFLKSSIRISGPKIAVYQIRQNTFNLNSTLAEETETHFSSQSKLTPPLRTTVRALCIWSTSTTQYRSRIRRDRPPVRKPRPDSKWRLRIPLSLIADASGSHSDLYLMKSKIDEYYRVFHSYLSYFERLILQYDNNTDF